MIFYSHTQLDPNHRPGGKSESLHAPVIEEVRQSCVLFQMDNDLNTVALFELLTFGVSFISLFLSLFYTFLQVLFCVYNFYIYLFYFLIWRLFFALMLI